MKFPLIVCLTIVSIFCLFVQSAQAQSVIPTIYCVGGSGVPPCAAFPSASPSVAVSPSATGTSQTPSTTQTSSSPTVDPCATVTSAFSNHSKQHRKWRRKGRGGGGSGFFEQLIQWLLKLIQQFLGGSPQPVPVTPSPSIAPVPSTAPIPSVAPCASASSSPSVQPITSTAPVISPSVAQTQPIAPSAIPTPSDGPWKSTMDDEFNGTSIDTSKWEVVDSNSTAGGYGLGGSCFANDGQHVLETGGNLILRATQAPSPMSCPGGLWNPKNYISGMVWSHKKFSQTYGRFEMRAKFPDGKGTWPAFWLWSENGLYNNAWTEIDVVEGYDYGSYTDTGATLHEVNGGDTQWCPITPDVSSNFHLYRMDWSANNISIYYDNKLCKTFTNWSASGLTNPQPFDQPMYILLNLAVGMNWGPNGATQTIPDGTNKWPMDMDVDYVRVWQKQ